MAYVLHPTPDDLQALREVTQPAARVRMLTERLIVRETCKLLLNAGLLLQLRTEEEPLSPLTRRWEDVMKYAQSTDYEWLDVYRMMDGMPRCTGTVFLVYGNDGWDVMADASLWVDSELAPVNALAESIADADSVVEGEPC